MTSATDASAGAVTGVLPVCLGAPTTSGAASGYWASRSSYSYSTTDGGNRGDICPVRAIYSSRPRGVLAMSAVATADWWARSIASSAVAADLK